MFSLTPWGVAARELVARPIPHARAERVSRLTAPTRSAWFWIAMWIAAGAAGFAALIPVLFGTSTPMPLYDVFHSLSGASFAACGLIAWHRRRDSAVGPLLTVAGFGVLIPEILVQVDSPLAVTVVALFGELWIMAYAALILSFVTGGRLTSRLDVAIVQAYFVGLFVLQFAVLLFLPDERNLLLVWPHAGVASALTKVQFGLLAV